ncbi:hypothetical protein [Isoptericola sp. 178]|uniref:hypothetical protein n=1 Tax=Isoptericola sp. 178 TaxID=3064651 RepID=UPI0027138A58|nr:hypothetical protein [Isoptericola sp. 178]MDO8144055.1 hypothetical protein [Isoptericola sp. 178]
MTRPRRDPALEPFDHGTVVLRRDGEVAGHVATTLGTFWSPARPLTIQQCVWFLVVWADGVKEPPFEDYAPWTAVEEIRAGTFAWEDGPHRGTYAATWLPRAQGEARWAELGITLDDF